MGFILRSFFFVFGSSSCFVLIDGRWGKFRGVSFRFSFGRVARFVFFGRY